MRNLHLNGLFYPLSANRGWTGWAIEDCDGTACGGEVCQNEGTCALDPNRAGGFICNCGPEFRGRNCEVESLCEDAGGCQNGATCNVVKGDVSCDCDVGYVGDRCETRKFDYEINVTERLFTKYARICIYNLQTCSHM